MAGDDGIAAAYAALFTGLELLGPGSAATRLAVLAAVARAMRREIALFDAHWRSSGSTFLVVAPDAA